MTSMSSGDSSASRDANIGLGAHISGDPGDISGGFGVATAGHTWLIVVGAVALLVLFGVGVFKNVRI